MRYETVTPFVVDAFQVDKDYPSSRPKWFTEYISENKGDEEDMIVNFTEPDSPPSIAFQEGDWVVKVLDQVMVFEDYIFKSMFKEY